MEKILVSGMASARRALASAASQPSRCSPERRPRRARWVITALLALICGSGLHLRLHAGSLSLSLPAAAADDIEYVYDELGRLVQASNRTSSQAILYAYDAAGNITSQTAMSLTALSVGYFSPQHGPSGAQVTISGTGFSATPSANTVTFNGVSAGVQTATTTQLVVTVPAGATTGPIGVQVGAASVTTAKPFTVTASADGPTITALFPTLGAPGNLFTISGTHFETVPTNNRVRLDNSPTLVTASTATTITTSVPANSGSGKVRLTTPSGVAVSPMDFIVVPSGYGTTSVGSTGRLPVNGAATNVSLPTANRISVQLFEGQAGDLLAIGVTNLALTSGTLKVFKPDGTSLATGTVTATVPGLQLPKLPVSGTYTLVVDPGSGTGSLTLSLVRPLQAALTLDGAPTHVGLATPGQRALLTFNGTQGTYANVTLSGVTVAAGTVSVIGPNGGVLDSEPFTTAGVTVRPQLPTTGVYTVLIDPTGSISGVLDAALMTATSPTFGVNQGTFNLSIANTTPVNVTFRGTAGQYLALAASTTQSTIPGVSFTVLKPDGSQLTTGSLSTTTGSAGHVGSVVINMGPLPLSGTYTVVVQETAAGSGTLALTLTTPLTGVLAADGTSTGVGITNPGQGLLYTATVSAGQYLAVALVESVNNPGWINAAAITVIRPDGTVLTTGTLGTAFLTCSGGGTCLGNSGYYGSAVVNGGPLPESGDYTILVQQTGTGQLDTGTVSVTLSTPQTSGPTLDGGTYSAPISSSGQGLLYTFSGSTGQYVAFTVAENADHITAAAITAFNPDGSQLAAGNLTTATSGSALYSGSVVVNLGPLAQDGTYTVLLQQTGSGQPDTGTLAVTLSTPLAGTLAADGSTTNVAISNPGQGVRYAISGSAGQYLAVRVAEHVDQVGAAAIRVLKPDGTLLVSGTLATTAQSGTFGGIAGYSGSSVMNAGPLPAAGTYTLLVQQTGTGTADTGTLSLTASGPLTGTLTANAASSGVAIANPGQPLQYSFAGSAGQIVAVTVTEHVDQINGATVSVIKPDGSVLATTSLTTTPVSSPLGGTAGYSGGVILNAGPLPGAGTYSVLVQQSGLGQADSGTLSLTLSSPATGAVAVGGATSVPILLPGQGISPTFTAAAGQYITVQVAESAGSYVSGAGVTVVNPDGSRLKAQAFNPTTCTTCDGYSGSTTVNVGAVPQTGTYAVLVQQTTLAGAGTGSLTVGVNQATPASGSTQNVATTTAGQVASFTFSATAGQNMGLALTNVVLTPAGVGYQLVQVFNPDGSSFTASNCYSGNPGCSISLLGLPQTGTYRVSVNPVSSNQLMTFTATVSADVTGVLTPGTPASIALSTLGQNAAYKFTTTTAGQSLTLNVSGVTTVPASTYVYLYLYNSAGTQVTNTATQTATTINLTNLPADTYTVLLTPQYPVTANLQLILQSAINGSTTVDGAPTTFSTPTPGQNAYFTFAGTAGQSIALAVTNMTLTPSGAGYLFFQVFSPDGTGLVGANCYSGNPGCALSMRNLPQTGTYNVVVTPPSLGQQMSFAAGFTRDVTGALTLGTPANVTLTENGQNGLFTFSTVAGQTVALTLAGVTTVPANTYVYLYVYNSAGSQVTNTATQTGTTLNLVNLAADTYTVLLSPQYPVTSSMQLTLQPGTTGALPVDGTAASFSTPAPGENGYLTFAGVAGQSLSFALNNIVLTPAGAGYVFMQVFAPDGSSVTAANCYSSNPGCEVSLRNLPLTGIYSVTVTPPSLGQRMAVTVTISPDVVGQMAVGTPVSVNLALFGQSALLGFTTTAGQTAALNLGGVAVTPASTYIFLYLYNSSGSQVANFQTQTGATVNLPNLPADTYSVLLTPQYPVTGTMQLTLEPGTIGALPSDSPGQTFSTPAPGQNAYFTFTGTAGQNVALALTNVVLTPAGAGYQFVQVFKPDGASLFAANCYSGNPGCDMSLRSLPQTGTYSVVVSPPSAGQQMSFAVTLSTDVTGTLSPSAPVSVNLAEVGQNGLYSFTATANQTVALNLSGTSVTPANTSVNVYVYNSAGTQVANGSTQTFLTLNLPNLPAGTYTVLVAPAYPVTGTLQITLEPGTTGLLPTDGTSANFSTPAPGQITYLTFAATAGQSVALALTNVVFTPAGAANQLVQIFKPDGTSLTALNCYSGNPGCEIPLRNLPQTGTYSVTINAPSVSQQASFTATVSTDVTGTLSSSVATGVNLASVGQNGLYTFTVTAGQTVAVSLSGIALTPTGTNYSAAVFNAAGTQVTTANSTAGLTVNLPNLPAGTYTVLLAPLYPVTGSLQLTLEPGVTGLLPADGTAQSFSTPTPGQNAYLTFPGTAGQNVALALTNILLTPAAAANLLVILTKPDGTSLTSLNCYSGNPGCEISLRNLPQTGTYSVTINSPSAGQQMSFAATFSIAATGGLVAATPFTVSLASTGQIAVLTFTTTVAKTTVLTIGSVSTTPVNTASTIVVYNSAGTTFGSYNSASAGTINMTNLPAGSYSVVIQPNFPLTGSMQVSYQ